MTQELEQKTVQGQEGTEASTEEQKATSSEQANVSNTPKAEETSKTTEEKKDPNNFADATRNAVASYLKSEDGIKRIQSEADKRAAKATETLTKQNRDLQRQMKDQELAKKEAKEIEQWGDTNEVKEFQQSRRELEVGQETLQEALSKLEVDILEVHAYKLHKEYDIPFEELLKCESTDAMEEKAVDLIIDAKNKRIKELEAGQAKDTNKKEDDGKHQQMDSGATSGGQVGSTGSPTSKIAAGLKSGSRIVHITKPSK